MRTCGFFRCVLVLFWVAFAGCSDDATSSGEESSTQEDTVSEVDVSEGDAVLLDTGNIGGDKPKEDVQEPDEDVVTDCTPGQAEFLCPCTENVDCASGFCVESQDGPICTDTCLTECPEGFSCKSVIQLLPDVVFICVPDSLKLCAPCQIDTQCGSGKCVTIGDAEYCTQDCTHNACSPGYICTPNDSELNGGFDQQCIPDTGVCDCSPEQDGMTRSCSVANEHGECFGFETCDALLGWTGCSAQEPAAESCNGQDDDCDGLTDEELPVGDPCFADVEGVGSCEGVQICMASGGWVCSASEPTVEVCDYVDNDCDDEVDEDFTTDGKYTTMEHCGSCNKSCEDGFPNATPKCDATKDTPQCVVAACDDGYFMLNEFQCVPNTSSLCQACATDDDCFFPDAKCMELGEGLYCGKGCEGDSDCPEDYVCGDYDGGLQCQPESGTCSCDGSNLSLSKSCSETYVDPIDPDAPTYTCSGSQACTADGWGECGLPEDVCDGLDNNCDGVVDEDYLNPATGKYFTDAHCGSCDNNCGGLFFANGTGACDTTGEIPVCTLVCNLGAFDVNDNPGDGCECSFSSNVDYPDGLDQNCDGVDGEIENAIFVAKDGDDANPGTIDAPALTVEQGIDKADAGNLRDVYVATGVYQESIRLESGIGVYGGYSSDFKQRDKVLYETVILGGAPTVALPGAVNGEGLDGDPTDQTIFNGFSVFGFNNKTPSGNSYGIYLRDCGAQVLVTENTVYAGEGGNGLNGGAGQEGASGSSGTSGGGAKQSSGNNCSGITGGGNGGSKTCGGVNVGGGGGGDAVCPDYDQSGSQPYSEPTTQSSTGAEGGNNGSNGGGQGGDAGWDFLVWSTNSCTSCLIPPNNHPWVGGDGDLGPDGAGGNTGSGCQDQDGGVQNAHWSGTGGSNGTSGGHGGGGGGGAAGGGVESWGCFPDKSDLGGSGGGGGSGGCAGTAGQSGTAGGGSFGIFLVWSAPPGSVPTIGDNEIVAGGGGIGGNGGFGGVGGVGGDGGAGGLGGAATPEAFCAAQGGYGAPGGDGGHGGGGGGGCGGVSYGVYMSGHGNWDLSAYGAPFNTFFGGGSGGNGGLGGPSLGNSGGNGQNGLSSDTNL